MTDVLIFFMSRGTVSDCTSQHQRQLTTRAYIMRSFVSCCRRNNMPPTKKSGIRAGSWTTLLSTGRFYSWERQDMPTAEKVLVRYRSGVPRVNNPAPTAHTYYRCVIFTIYLQLIYTFSRGSLNKKSCTYFTEVVEATCISFLRVDREQINLLSLSHQVECGSKTK
jgi:hypothetical protein